MILLLALLACDDTIFGVPTDAQADGGTTGAPTWYTDVLPIVEARCSACHVSGGIGPFPLTTYADAKPMAGAMSGAAQSRLMPPWPPDDDCNSYKNDRSLTEAEIQTLADWAAAGAPEGDATQAVHASLDSSTLGEPDLTLPLPEPYTPADVSDDYRCFLLDVSSPSDLFLTGFAVDPDQDSIVHHVIAYLAEPDQVADYQALDAADDGPGWACFGGPGGDEALTWLGSWVPGSLGDKYPEGTGIAVPKGSTAVVQMHYNMDYADPVPDQTSISFWASPSVDKQALLVKLLDPTWPAGSMPIEAGNPDVVYSYEVANPLNVAIQLWAAGLHMHLIGSSASLVVKHSDGTEECAMDIPDWDFHWQGLYFLQTPIRVEADDKVEVTCHFDGSDLSSDLNWGENSTDEMCLALMYGTLAD